MRIFKCFLVVLLVVLSISVPAFAKNEKIEVKFKENTIGLTLSSDYLYFTAEDVEKSADYFKKMPVDKQEAVKEINDGTYLNAFCESKGSQIVLKITSDNFSKTIANFTPMDENDKKSVIKNFKSIYEQGGHSFLTEPDVIQVDGYDFIRFNCRYGSGDKGFSYKSILTIIGGNCYEFIKYSKLSVPDDEINNDFDDLVSSVSMNIKGETGQIAKSFFMSVVAIIIIIIAIIIAVSMIYSLFKEFILHKNRGEKVRLKKR